MRPFHLIVSEVVICNSLFCLCSFFLLQLYICRCNFYSLYNKCAFFWFLFCFVLVLLLIFSLFQLLFLFFYHRHALFQGLSKHFYGSNITFSLCILVHSQPRTFLIRREVTGEGEGKK